MGVLSFRAFLADLPGCFRRASFGNTLAIASEKALLESADRGRPPTQLAIVRKGSALVIKVMNSAAPEVGRMAVSQFTRKNDVPGFHAVVFCGTRSRRIGDPMPQIRYSLLVTALVCLFSVTLFADRDEGQYVILSAQYGTRDHHVDVTRRLRELARSDRSFRMDNRTF